MKKQQSRYRQIQNGLWTLLDTSSRKNKFSIIDDIIIWSLIILNTILLGLSSFSELSNDPTFSLFYHHVTVASIWVFSLEYVLSLWSCIGKSEQSHPLWTRVRFVLSFSSIVDLIVIFAVILLGTQANLIFLHLMRVTKVISYLGEDDEYSPVLILKRSFLNKKEELFITIVFSLGLLLLCSCIIFYFEAQAQPSKFENITPSITWVFSVLMQVTLVDFTPVTLVGKIFHVLMTILGIVVVGLPVGIITGSFISEITESKRVRILKENSTILIKSFQHEQKVSIRRLMDELALESERKVLDLDVAMSRLQFSQKEIFEAVKYSPHLRIRACKQSIESTYEDNLVLEAFPVNTSFGSFIDRQSDIHIVSTQSVGDIGIGHFSRLVAAAANANYYSNEFFSTGNLLKETQINFANNELYNSGGPISGPLLDWVNILTENIQKGDIVVYLGTASAQREPIFHVLCGGKKGQENFADIEEPTVDNIHLVQDFYSELCAGMKEFDLSVTSHAEFGNTNRKHLSQVFRNNYNANVVTIYVSLKLLQFMPEEIYYRSIRVLADCAVNCIGDSAST